MNLYVVVDVFTSYGENSINGKIEYIEAASLAEAARMVERMNIENLLDSGDGSELMRAHVDEFYTGVWTCAEQPGIMGVANGEESVLLVFSKESDWFYIVEDESEVYGPYWEKWNDLLASKFE